MLQFICFLLLIFFLNSFWAKRIAIVKIAQNLAVFRKLDPTALNLPIWQSALCIFCIGVLVGICPPFSDCVNSNVHLDAPLLFIRNLALAWIAFAMNFVLIMLSLRRRENIFKEIKPHNLLGVISASQVITLTFFTVLSFSGASYVTATVLGIYSLLVCAKAITDHIYQTSFFRNFCIVVLSTTTTLVFVLFLSSITVSDLFQ